MTVRSTNSLVFSFSSTSCSLARPFASAFISGRLSALVSPLPLNGEFMRKDVSADSRAADSDRVVLANQIDQLLSRLQTEVTPERRNTNRAAIPYLFRITPLDDARQPDHDDATIVVGKNLSRRGISFYHERPISHRRAWIELVQPGLGTFVAEVDITWCRFNKPGWYESGGRLVRAVQTNSAPPKESTTFADVTRLTTFLELSLPAAWA